MATEVETTPIENDPALQAAERAGMKFYSIDEINTKLASSEPAPETEEEQEETPTTTTQAEEPDEETKQFNTLFEKRHGKKYEEVAPLLSRKSFDEEATEKWGKPVSEIEETIKNPKSVAKELKSEYSKKLEDWIENGGIEKDFHDIQRMNWEGMSHEELIKAELKSKHPKADNAKIDILFKAEFKAPKPLDPYNFSEEEVAERQEEIEAYNVRLELRAEEVREAKIAQRIKALEAPIQKEVVDNRTPEQKEKDRIIQEKGEKNFAKTQEEFTKYKGLNLSVTDKDSAGKEVVSNLSFELKPQQKELVNQIVRNPQDLPRLYIDKDGNMDSQGFIDAVTRAVVGNTAFAEMAKDFKHESKKEFIKKELKNADFSQSEVVKPVSKQEVRNKELVEIALANS